MNPFLRFCLLLSVGAPAVAAETSAWSKLEMGMSAADAFALLGEPILASHGHGFERWTYDRGAEVLLFGSVVGWTSPASEPVSQRGEDVWRKSHPGGHHDTLHAVLGQPPALPRRKTRPGHTGVGFEEYIRG